VGRTLVIDRPHLLRLIDETRCLPSDHPLKRWCRTETVLERDEYELDQWPERSVSSLLSLAADVSDPYLDPLRIALAIRSGRMSMAFPAGTTIQEAYEKTTAAASSASDELLQLLVANQALVLSGTQQGVVAHRFTVVAWELGCRLSVPDPLVVYFYLDAMWGHWNSFPRHFALSHVDIPPARALVEHLHALDPSRFEGLRRFLLVQMDLEDSLAQAQSTASTAMATCLETRALLYELLELLQSGPGPVQENERRIHPEHLAGQCHDIAMAFFYLEEYGLGLELLRVSMSLYRGDDDDEIAETIGVAMVEVGLLDAAR